MESPLGRLKDHILVLFGSEDVRRLISVFWLWRPVLLPLRREFLFSLLQLSIRRRRVSLLLVRDLCRVSTSPLGGGQPRRTFFSL